MRGGDDADDGEYWEKPPGDRDHACPSFSDAAVPHRARGPAGSAPIVAARAKRGTPKMLPGASGGFGRIWRPVAQLANTQTRWLAHRQDRQAEAGGASARERRIARRWTPRAGTNSPDR